MAATMIRRATLAAGAAGMLVVPVGGWYVASAATAAHVTVQTHLTWCRDTPLRTERVEDDDRPHARVEVLTVTPRTRCRVRVRVRNDGTFPVHLERGVAPGLGPAGGAVLQAEVRVDGHHGPVLDPDDGDASAPLDRELAAGESTAFWILLSARDQGCTAGRTTITAWPRVEASSLGRDVGIIGGRDLAFRWRTGQNPGCLGS